MAVKIVRRIRILAIEAELIGGADELDVAMCRTCRPRRCTGSSTGIAGRRRAVRDIRPGGKLVDALGPDGCGEGHEQNDLEDENATFELGGQMAGRADVVRLRVFLMLKTPERVEIKRAPADEEDEHEPVQHLEHAVDGVAVKGGVRRDAEGFHEDGKSHRVQEAGPGHWAGFRRRSRVHRNRAADSWRGRRGTSHKARSCRAWRT